MDAKPDEHIGWVDLSKIIGANLPLFVSLGVWMSTQFSEQSKLLALQSQQLEFAATRVAALEAKVGEYGELKYKFGSIAESMAKLEKRMDFMDTHVGAVTK